MNLLILNLNPSLLQDLLMISSIPNLGISVKGYMTYMTSANSKVSKNCGKWWFKTQESPNWVITAIPLGNSYMPKAWPARNGFWYQLWCLLIHNQFYGKLNLSGSSSKKEHHVVVLLFAVLSYMGGVPTIGGFKMMCLFSRLGGKIKHHLDPRIDPISLRPDCPCRWHGREHHEVGNLGLFDLQDGARHGFIQLKSIIFTLGMMIGKLPFSFLGMLQIQWEIITGNSSSEAADSSDSSLRGFRHQVSAEILSLQIWMIYMILIRLRSEIGKYWRWNLQVSWRCFVLNHEKSILTPCFDSVWQQPHPASHLGDGC